MLDLLAKQAHDAEPGFKEQEIRWAIVLQSGTDAPSVQELGDAARKNNRGLLFPRCPDLKQSEIRKARSHFLTGNANVVALYRLGGNAKEDEKVKKKHESFVKMIDQASKAAPQLTPIVTALLSETTLCGIREALANHAVKPIENVTFQLDGQFPVEQDYWHDWWRDYRMSLQSTKSGEVKRAKGGTALVPCFVYGTPTVPVLTHSKIKGLSRVGEKSEAVLIGFDKDAFCSYGLKQSANAAVSERAMSEYCAGLNRLIRTRGELLAGVMVIPWFKSAVLGADDPFQLLYTRGEPTDADAGEPDTPSTIALGARERAAKLIRSIQNGERPDLIHDNYYVLTISGTGGRVMVRDWTQGPFKELAFNVSRWFDDLEIVNLGGEKSASSPRLDRLVTCLLPPQKDRQDYKHWIKPVGSARITLLHAAIKGTPIPTSFLARLVIEHRNFVLDDDFAKLLAGEQTTAHPRTLRSLIYARMALVRAYHIRKHRKEGNINMVDNLKPALNEEHPSAAYHCGRLLAVLAKLQQSALGSVGAGVVQRYYPAASTTPALVLGNLTRTSQFHINKLGRPKLAYWYESRIAGIWSKLGDSPPKTLSLEEQSLFALGYYHQWAALFKKAKKGDPGGSQLDANEDPAGALGVNDDPTEPQGDEDPTEAPDDDETNESETNEDEEKVDD